MNAVLEQRLRQIRGGPRGARIGAFFDFDGTLIDGYSAAAYFTDRVARGEMGVKEVMDTVKLARQKDLTDDEFTAIIRKGILDWAGETEDEMRALWQRLWQEKVAKTLFPEGWQLVTAHREMGHTVAIASSATPWQIEPLAAEYGIEHILATQPMIRRGRLTGGLATGPLWGQGKADAVKAFAREQRITLSKSYGYANGDEDIAFLKSVGLPSAVQPKPLLEAVAEREQWPILRFPRRSRATPATYARTVGAYAAMFGTFAAGIGYARLSGKRREAVDFMASVSSDAALAVLGINVEVVGEEHLWAHRPCVFIINHQSKIDMFLMMHLVRKGFTGVAKAEAAKTPGFGTFMKMADMAFLDRSHTGRAVEALKPAVERLQRGLSVCIAPEGTRSWTPKVGKFKKGAFHMAMQAGVPVVPVVLRNAGEVMGRNDQAMRPGTVQVAVLPPVDVSDWTVETMDARIAEVRQQFVDTLEHWPTEERT